MSDAIRPSGLTVLAAINFVMGGIAALGAIAMTVVAIAMLSGGGSKGGDFEEVVKTFGALSPPLLMATYVLTVACAVLQLWSARGFLKMRRFAGYVLGNAYAIVAIVSSALGAYISTMNPEFPMGFNMFTVVNLVYPLLLLFLLNFIFREDFVR